MVTRPKKPRSKKKPIASPEELLADAAAASMAEGAAEPAEAPAEQDYGRGVGELLDSVGGFQEPPEAGEAATEKEFAPTVEESERTSVESILTRARHDPSYDPKPKPAEVVSVTKKSGSRASFLGLVALVVLLVLLAGGGIYMFAQKNGMTQLTSLFGDLLTKGGPEAPPEEAGTQPTPQAPTSVSVLFIATTGDAAAGEKPTLKTRIIETDVTASDSFSSTGEAPAKDARATGTLTIINTTSQPYTFVATTRFLSKEGVLFRLKQATNIPANGSVNAEVYADQPGPSGNIGPTTFTIPGLPTSLQDDIYAKSDSAMTGGDGTVKIVSEADLAAAKIALTEKLKAEALENFQVMLAAGEKVLPELLSSTELSVKAPKAGSQAASFTMTLSLRFRALLVPEPAVLGLLSEEVKASLPPGENTSDYELGSPMYTVEAYDTAGERAEIRAEAAVQKL